MPLASTPNKPNNDPKLISFLFGENDFVIYFFEQGSQIDEYLSSGAKNTSEIIFTLSEIEEEVKEWLDKVIAAGGNIFHETGRDETNHYSFAF